MSRLILSQEFKVFAYYSLRKAKFASPSAREKSSLRLPYITQSIVCISNASHKVQFAFPSAHAKLSLRHQLLTQSSVCVSIYSRKVQFASPSAHAKFSLRLPRLTQSSVCVSLGSRKLHLVSHLSRTKLPLRDQLWQDRFINFIERQPNGDNMMKSLTEGPMERLMKVILATATTLATTVEKDLREYDVDELLRYQANNQAKSNLILALPIRTTT
ncbi:hypothetical protein L6452_43448 [Arctium lappa]|uniref:Uncharacterized protein n=1 Tax=Arctium lappa TaxID=4217 RepID=A0ACB8XEP1_ARCLA|nr:hypothetical protein L6452_43448 [Arctium lappa]